MKALFVALSLFATLAVAPGTGPTTGPVTAQGNVQLSGGPITGPITIPKRPPGPIKVDLNKIRLLCRGKDYPQCGDTFAIVVCGIFKVDECPIGTFCVDWPAVPEKGLKGGAMCKLIH